ncbi:MAG TPA: hypothetical protein VNJ04_19600 [Gemmatimonadaceae bacterium]|nr:hypothetical protein [Gemmatimonadaceae bacterium]
MDSYEQQYRYYASLASEGNLTDPYDEWRDDQQSRFDDLTNALYPVAVESPTFTRQPDGSFAWWIDTIPF